MCICINVLAVEKNSWNLLGSPDIKHVKHIEKTQLKKLKGNRWTDIIQFWYRIAFAQPTQNKGLVNCLDIKFHLKVDDVSLNGRITTTPPRYETNPFTLQLINLWLVKKFGIMHQCTNAQQQRVKFCIWIGHVTLILRQRVCYKNRERKNSRRMQIDIVCQLCFFLLTCI